MAHASTVHLIAVSYIIVSGTGPNEGCVITRDRNSAADVWRLQAPATWFLVQTNYDHWLPVRWRTDKLGGAGSSSVARRPADRRGWAVALGRMQDPPSDYRRVPAEQRMNATDMAHVSLDYLFTDVLSQYPNLNGETTYTAVYSAATGAFQCVTQNNNA